jgi:hypothetical protein
MSRDRADNTRLDTLLFLLVSINLLQMSGQCKQRTTLEAGQKDTILAESRVQCETGFESQFTHVPEHGTCGREESSALPTLQPGDKRLQLQKAPRHGSHSQCLSFCPKIHFVSRHKEKKDQPNKIRLLATPTFLSHISHAFKSPRPALARPPK